VSHLKGFGRFWYDFLVGDRPELFVGPILALALAWLLLQANVTSAVTAIVLIVAVGLVGAISLYLTTRITR
jgi:hypothetical protein